ncbi:hypothetical protein V6N11_076086 [Hibiscus sabdariffa]|uniref:Uncharacterized protein n=1 Tax=Hibiscus sabdariffa TaxID=183260 RepID=A0ABR2Q566_9ROSI
MAAKRSGVFGENRWWYLLRLTLLWARNVKVKLKELGAGNKAHRTPYLQRQLSFDRSPDFHFSKGRLKSSMASLFPCVASKAAEFDYSNDNASHEDANYAYLTEEEEEEEEECGCNGCEKASISDSEEEGIDSRAEKFIAEFYGEIKGLRVD